MKWIYAYSYDCLTLLYGRKENNIIKQLFSIKKRFLRSENLSTSIFIIKYYNFSLLHIILHKILNCHSLPCRRSSFFLKVFS